MDLSTQYMGLTLKNPVVAAPSPMTYTMSGIRRLEDAGISAVVLSSLFEEQIVGESQRLDHFLTYGTETFAEALTYFPEQENYNMGPEEYLSLIRESKEAVKIPVIASLNGVSVGGWTHYSRLMEQAGADALELNIYYIPTDPNLTSVDVEKMYLDVLKDVRKSVHIPVAMKIGPYFSSLANVAKQFVGAGANGLVLFNRFYQPDLDLEELEVVPNLVLSSSNSLRLALRWVAILYGRNPVDFAVTNGVHTHLDVLKAMMAGASVTQIAAEFLRKGPGRVTEILSELSEWMQIHEYESIKQMQGSLSQRNCAEPAAFERANYMKVLQSWKPDPAGIRN